MFALVSTNINHPKSLRRSATRRSAPGPLQSHECAATLARDVPHAPYHMLVVSWKTSYTLMCIGNHFRKQIFPSVRLYTVALPSLSLLLPVKWTFHQHSYSSKFVAKYHNKDNTWWVTWPSEITCGVRSALLSRSHFPHNETSLYTMIISDDRRMWNTYFNANGIKKAT